MAWKDGFVIEYAPRKKKPRKKRKKTARETQHSSAGTRKPKTGSGSITVGKWVESPEYGKGKIVAVDGKWASVEYTMTSTRKRYDMARALASGKLRRI